MEITKNKKSYIIIAVIILLVISVFVSKQIFGDKLYHECDDGNCNHDQSYLYKNNDIYGNTVEKTYKIYNFSSALCGVCIQMKPIYEKVKEEYETSINFVYVDTDKDYELSNKYKIMYTPTFVVVDNNQNEVDRLVGYVPEEKFREFVKKWGNK